MQKFILDYNGYMAIIEEAIAENKKIPTTSDHEVYIYTMLIEFYKKGYPKQIEIFNGQLNQSNTREDLPNFNDGIILNYVVMPHKIYFNTGTFYPGVPNAAYAKRNPDKDLPGEDVYLRYGFLPINVSVLVPNLSIYAKVSNFVDRFYNEYLFRQLQLTYENAYSNLVRHIQPTQPFSDSKTYDERNYIIKKVFRLPITEIISIKSSVQITDITLSGTHSIMDSNKGVLPPIRQEFKKED